MQQIKVAGVFDAVKVLLAAKGIKIPASQETKLRFESINSTRWSMSRWRKIRICTDFLPVDTEEEDISEAQRSEIALRIASSYLRCKVHLASYSSVSAASSDKGVALADNQTILTCTHLIPVELNLLLEGESRLLQLTLYRLEGIDYDIILGWRDILKYGLLEVLQKLYQPDRSTSPLPKPSSIKKGTIVSP